MLSSSVTQVQTARSGARIRFLLSFALLATFLGACTDFLADAAIAYDIESAVGDFAHPNPATTTIVHVPKSSRGGCNDDYRVQFSHASSLVVWCYAPGSTKDAVSSHTTTYHLRFVDVPQTIIVDKKRGESLSIEIEKGASKPVVKAVH